MKKSNHLLLLAALCMSVFATPASAKVWPLFCKTGPALTVQILFSINSGPSSLNVYYPKASKPAGNRFENLKAGECSWPDRVMKPDERSSAVFHYGTLLGASAPFVTINLGNENTPTTWSITDSKINRLRSAAGEKFKMFVEMQNGQLTIESSNGDPHIEWVR